MACFDTVQFLPYRLGGGEARAVDWELSRGLTWADAPAPAQVGRRAVERNFRIELPDRRASLAYHLVHWGYGIAWGGLFGLVAGSVAKLRLRHGLVFGTLVRLTGYVILPLAKLYRPLWTYEPAALGWDWTAHLVYGLSAVATLKLLDR